MRRIASHLGSSEVLYQHQVGVVTIVLRKADELLVLRNRETGASESGTRTRETHIFELPARLQSQHPQAGQCAAAKKIETAPGDGPVWSRNVRHNQLGFSAARWH